MTFKTGDLVIMNNKGFTYHGNPYNMFDSYKVGEGLRYRHIEMLVCELFSIQGVGEVISVNDGFVNVKFKNNIKGMYFYFTMFYNLDHISKLTFFQKLKYKLLGRV